MTNLLCQCKGDQYPIQCDRHCMKKGEGLHNHCKLITNSGIKYWQMWEQGEGGACEPEEPNLDPPINPSLMQKARNLAGSTRRFLRSRGEVCSKEEYEERIQICEGCSFHRNNTCSLCGCQFRAKAWGRQLNCPHPSGSKWPALLPRPRSKNKFYDPNYIAPKPRKFEGEVKRNLMFHIWPRNSARWVWMKFIDNLKRDIQVFNNKRIVGITYGDDTAEPQEVMDLLKGHVEEFIIHPNQKNRGEVQTFPEMLDYIMNDNPDEITFYGHAKGIKHKPDLTVHDWADLMYEANVHYHPKVEHLLQRGFGLVGPFKQSGNRGHAKKWGGYGWHYSGTMFWFRNSDIWKRNWREVLNKYHGVEAWPAQQLQPEDAACLFYEPQANMYDSDQFNNLILPAWKEWKNDNAAYHYSSNKASEFISAD